MTRTAMRREVERVLDGAVSDEAWDVMESEGHVLDAEITGDIQHLTDLLRRAGVPVRRPRDYKAASVVADFDDPRIGYRSDALGAWAARLSEHDIERWRSRAGAVDVASVTTWIRNELRRVAVADWPYPLDPRPAVQLESGLRTAVWLSWWGEDTWYEWPAPPTPTFEDLARLVEELVDKWRWDDTDAFTFVIGGGAPPPVNPAHVSGDQRLNFCTRRQIDEGLGVNVDAFSRLTLTLDPALTPAQVADIWRRVRNSYFDRRQSPQTERHLRLAGFMAGRREGQSWGALRAAWNREFQQWAYSQRGNFQRDAMAAMRRLLATGIRPVPRRD